MKQYFDKTSCRNICYAHRLLPKFNSIRSVASLIFAKEFFKIRAIAKPIPVYWGWVKKQQRSPVEDCLHATSPPL